MQLGFSEYLVLAVTLGGVIVGLFVGLSGTLAFLSGSVVSGLAAKIAWQSLATVLPTLWSRILVVSLAALFVFWVVRLIVAKTIRLVVAQPGDSIFGALAAGVSAYLILAAVAWVLAMTGITDVLWQTPFLHGVFTHFG